MLYHFVLQVEDLRLSEKLLQTKVKNLTSELAALKKAYRTPSASVLRKSFERRKSDTGERSVNRKFRNLKLINTGTRLSCATREMKLASKHGSRSPSPRVPRFDPTAYVDQKKRRNAQIRFVWQYKLVLPCSPLCAHIYSTSSYQFSLKR